MLSSFCVLVLVLVLVVFIIFVHIFVLFLFLFLFLSLSLSLYHIGVVFKVFSEAYGLAEDPQRDEAISERLRSLGFLREEHLGVPPLVDSKVSRGGEGRGRCVWLCFCVLPVGVPADCVLVECMHAFACFCFCVLLLLFLIVCFVCVVWFVLSACVLVFVCLVFLCVWCACLSFFLFYTRYAVSVFFVL